LATPRKEVPDYLNKDTKITLEKCGPFKYDAGLESDKNLPFL